MSKGIGQDLINKPVQDLRNTQNAQKRADEKRSHSKTVLNLSDVLTGNKTYINEALKTINDNQAFWAEQLTPSRLKQLANTVQNLQKDFARSNISGGITPNTVIARSRRIDIQRAEREIHTLQAVRFEKDGVIRFRTNASVKHGATHHIVSVQFLNFQAVLNGGRLTNKLLDEYMKSAVKFDCDCGRHRYWYRYIATIGAFAYGKPETGFPKVRNPELTGMACKHVIRVMHTLARKPATLRNAVKMHIERYRKDPNQMAKTLTKKQADKAKITVSGGRISKIKAYEKMNREVEQASKSKMNESDKRTARIQAENLKQMGLITEETYNEIIKQLS